MSTRAHAPMALATGLAMAATLCACTSVPFWHRAPAPAAAQAQKGSPYLPTKVSGSAMHYYGAYGGVGELRVRLTASGNLIRLSYRVLDPGAARVLADKNVTPYLFGQRSHALLQVPAMENVGQLRQTGQLQPGRMYWMVFSNKGNLVKPGDRVSVVAGAYHLDGLMVE
ncbi:hypothetical protein [Ralstonia solanacearum]|uniref:hypothetical protein n=1 Tax=Ralstonia solanacearum TaxID=305 RepID=UPI00078B5541|nr:hypothetical protein [Ralstonia solanacearum]AMP37631.1 hypothetical protein LBM2029_08815 [Ralstonia solanacearum]AXV86457.1 hypothetical protein CJO78_09135 [Ralstonia solanacearum]AXW05960.1 hypothetical protein CJO82_08910 [Ralstonia solanacearum]AXW23704.1 hypothetical protein CJO86_08915 [Ralstonia solanacearum]AXW80636.1 hypothetical protein CJO98_09145 [Ralstonia solanacearum]